MTMTGMAGQGELRTRRLLAIMACAAALLKASCAEAAGPPRATPLWSGFYIGGNIGYGSGISTGTTTVVEAFGAVSLANEAYATAGGPKGAIGGGQLGYSWQVSEHAVLGLEGDWQAAAGHTSQQFAGFAEAGQSASGPMTTTTQARILSFGTLRGRVGYAWDRLMLYGTGGLALGDVKLSGAVNEFVDLVGLDDLAVSWPFGGSKLRAGWTLGAGIEGALTNNWTLKFEYLYLDFGSVSTSTAVTAPDTIAGTISTQARFADNIWRIGFNYQFH